MTVNPEPPQSKLYDEFVASPEYAECVRLYGRQETLRMLLRALLKIQRERQASQT